MACEGESLAYINFRYSGEDWQIIKSTNPPVNHNCLLENNNEANFTGGQCVGVIYRVKWHRIYDLHNNNPPNYSYSYTDYSTDTATLTGSIGRLTFTSNPNNGFRWYILSNGVNIQVGSVVWDAPFLANIYRNPRGYIESVERVDGQPDNCGNPPSNDKYRFTVTDATGIIFSQTDDSCPEVNIKCGESCPPGTCECVCKSDGLVCCYSDIGIAVKSFYR